jgi:hypothetical protein
MVAFVFSIIQEVPGWNSAGIPAILTELFVAFHVPSSHMPRQYLKLGPDHFISHLFQFIVHCHRIIQCCIVWIIDGYYQKSRDSAVGITTGYRLDNRGVGVRVLVESRIFTSPCHPDQLWGQLSFLSDGYQGPLSPAVKWLGHETDHSSPTSAEVKKMWVNTCTPYMSSWRSG